jgi:hypothetical protein
VYLDDRQYYVVENMRAEVFEFFGANRSVEGIWFPGAKVK